MDKREKRRALIKYRNCKKSKQYLQAITGTLTILSRLLRIGLELNFYRISAVFNTEFFHVSCFIFYFTILWVC